MHPSFLHSPSEAFGHSGRVFGLTFHPVWGNGAIASASEDESVRVWSRSTATGSWEQTSCCKGHTAEVLRVAWSPNGSILASGSADHTVRLWQVGLHDEQSYAGVQLCVLDGHPEEVYGLKFLTNTAASSNSISHPQQHSSNGVSGRLVTASGESLFLWDLQTGQLLHESAPLPVPDMANLSLHNNNSSSSIGSSNGSSAAASGDADINKQQQRQQQPEGRELGPMPSYIFSLAQAEGTSWLAGCCSDGMLRLWEAAAHHSLQQVAAVKVHPTDMGSWCSFVPQQPWLILSISKSGQLVLQDLRRLGHPLLQQQLPGPVYDAAWAVQQGQGQHDSTATAADGSSAAGAAAAAAAAAGELVLCVVGRDHCVRSYAFTTQAIQAGVLWEPQLQPLPGHYSGRLLAVTATADGRTVAAAGEPVPADTLKPWTSTAVRQQRQQQQQQQGLQLLGQQLHQQNVSQQERGSAARSIVVMPAAPAAKAAAAVVAVAARGRKGRSKTSSSSSRQAVDLFGMTETDDAADMVSGARSQQQKAVQDAQQQQPQQQQLVTEAAADLQADAAVLRAAGEGSVDVAVPSCAAAAGVLMRAPISVWQCS